MPAEHELSLRIENVEEGEPDSGGVREVRIHTDAGVIEARFHKAAADEHGILFVFGAGGGLGGPAGGLYVRMAERFAPEGVASLRLDYRRPGELHDCVLDVLAGVAYLESKGRRKIVLVGHSFGGAVVINAGVATDNVHAVAALSSQSAHTEAVAELSPKPLLLMHGESDEVLPDRCSRDLFRRAKEPKELLLYRGCRHGLDDCREEVDRDLYNWLWDVTRGPAR